MKNTKEQQKQEQNDQIFFRKKDILLVVSILLVAVVAFSVWSLTKKTGAQAQVVVVQNGKSTTTTIVLDKDHIAHIENGALPVTLEIAQGRIRFINSVCPDHRCEGFGWLQNEGEKAICLPAGVWVEIVN